MAMTSHNCLTLKLTLMNGMISYVGKVSVVGVGMRSQPGVAADVFDSLGSNGINIEMITTSEIKISCLIKEKDLDKATRILHERFHPREIEG